MNIGLRLLGSGLVLVGLAAAGCARRRAPVERVQVSNVSAIRTAFGGSQVETVAAPATIAEPTGWATIRGTFKIDGTPPPRATLKADKEPHICAPGGKSPLSEEIVVDPATGGIKDIVIYLTGPHKKFPAGDPKWEHPDYVAKANAEPEFDQKACVFKTHMMAFRSPQKLKILNSDPTGHNTKIKGGGRAKPDNISVAANSYTNYEPGGESPEPFDVSCSIHPWMSAWMIVRDSPYFAVTKPDGTFEIANVPAGVELEFRVWQEKSRFITSATVNGKQETWPKGRVKIPPLTDGQPLALDVTVKAEVFAK